MLSERYFTIAYMQNNLNPLLYLPFNNNQIIKLTFYYENIRRKICIYEKVRIYLYETFRNKNKYELSLI